jgi:catechol 2,3-dioxygenase-like lactoylglutathione lyase family enzyme
MALTDSSVSVMLPISDPDRARTYYADKLGLPYQGTNDEQSLLFGLGNGAQLVLLPRPDEKPSPSTAMSFEVTGIEDEVKQLEDRGVEFQDYDLPDLKTVDHVCVMGAEKAAWMMDPDGNVLCVHETVK